MSSPQAAPHSLNFADLQAARQRSDALTFGQIARALHWEGLSAKQIEAAIQMGLDMAMLQIPRELATLGVQLHPEDESLQRLHNLLKPSRVSLRPGAISPEQRRDRDWLRTNQGISSGKWLALRDGALLAEGLSYAELQEKLGAALERATTITKQPAPRR